MRAANVRRVGTHSFLLLALLALGLFASSCRNDEVEVPPLTGPSGHRLFITMEARPDHLVIHAPGRPRESSQLTVQLKNQQGVGVGGENIKLRIANSGGAEINIGRLSDYNVTTDSAGFARVTYVAPDSGEQSRAILVYVYAILTNPAYPYEVTDRHGIDLELSAVQPGTCIEGFPGAPVADFDVDPNPGTISNPVCFDAQSSQDDGFIVGYNWNFGDGSSANGEVVCHEYSAEGSYNVTLLIQDDEHNCDRISQLVNIERGDPATCNIIVSPSGAVPGEVINFTAIVDDPDGQVSSYLWTFGDGTKKKSNKNVITHSYNTIGSYTVVLTIIDDQGNESTCTTTVTISTGSLPSCTFTFGPTPIELNDVVNFNATASTDSDGTITRYTWDFGDGSPLTTESDPLITHVYTVSGTFIVTLTVEDDDGNVVTCTQTVSVNSNPPVCNFSMSTNNGNTPLLVNFDATSSSDDNTADADLLFAWSFGDGSTGVGITTSHTFTATCTGPCSTVFTVNLIVTDEDGNSTACSNQVTVNVP